MRMCGMTPAARACSQPESAAMMSASGSLFTYPRAFSCGESPPMKMSAWRCAISDSLRRHYPDQVLGSVAAATLSAHRIVRAPHWLSCVSYLIGWFMSRELAVSCFLFRGPMWSFRAAPSISDGIPPLQRGTPIQNLSDDGIPPLQTWTLPQNFCDAVTPSCRHLHARKTACRHKRTNPATPSCRHAVMPLCSDAVIGLCVDPLAVCRHAVIRFKTYRYPERCEKEVPGSRPSVSRHTQVRDMTRDMTRDMGRAPQPHK